MNNNLPPNIDPKKIMEQMKPPQQDDQVIQGELALYLFGGYFIYNIWDKYFSGPDKYGRNRGCPISETELKFD